jgi:TetR/AcrR family transcriptional regulator, transcriptional repressor for nem operon
MTIDSTDGCAETTRRQILRAASYQFARRAYHDVCLADIMTEAELAKDAMYLHFHSKYALAVAIIERQTAACAVAMEDVLSRSSSGLEALIDFSYLIAARDIQTDEARAGLNLLVSAGRSEGMQERVLDNWIQTLAAVVHKAIAEGDIDKRCSPQDVARLMVSLHMGLRHASSLDEPERFLLDLEKSWSVVLTGILQPERIEYFSQFVRRRTALAIGARSTGGHWD